MTHCSYTTHHLPRRDQVPLAIAVVVVMVSIGWVVMAFGERTTFGVDWGQSQMAPPASNSVPEAGCAWLDWIRSSRPIGIAELPGRLGGKQHDRSPAGRTWLCK